MHRCFWVNLKNEKYVSYHDFEWGKPTYNDAVLFEFLLLECFQAGLSWEIILNKRDAFREAFDQFDCVKISQYGEAEIVRLMGNPRIIRNRRKLEAVCHNARCFLAIQQEFGSFSAYIWSFTNHEIIVNQDGQLRTRSELSDRVTLDLKKRGMKFLGTTTVYSYLQAIGVVNDHDLECDFRFTS